MKIECRRIGKTPIEFTLEKEEIRFFGSIVFQKGSLFYVNGHIEGHFNAPCDICAEPFDTILNEVIEILVSDGMYKGMDEALDVVEMTDSVVDMETIFHSEIELIKCDYRRCPDCDNITVNH
ncbi:MAG: hypothetical protein DSZ03_08750 [Sulfurimonas sp.]|nr:MAG: hypothetical protein DSZ03_08750 [Sulfurimonas sp.]